MRRDAVHALDPKSMGVLLHLAEAAPGFVSIDALLARTWSGAVVGDNALYQVISRLRRCFDDDPHTPAVIETLSKRGYRLKVPVQRAIERTTTKPATIAVLPFEDRSPAPPDPYLAEGLTLEIHSQLAKVAALRIISRDAVLAGLAAGMGSAAVASSLGAGYAVAGTVRAEQGSVRVTVQLDDVDAQRQLWSATFDRARDDLLALHSEVAIATTQALQMSLSALERARIDRPGTVSLAAYQLMQRATRFDPAVMQDNRSRSRPSAKRLHWIRRMHTHWRKWRGGVAGAQTWA
jgi:TolB-like protein